MASPHCKVKNGIKGSGAKHARYVAGEGRYADREDVAYTEDGNLPKWAKNAAIFFAAADKFERGGQKSNGRSYKEVECAIPREAADPVQWARDYACHLLGDRHPYRIGIHIKEASDGKPNPHMHLMFSTRILDGHERPKEKFFSRAAVSLKKGVPVDPRKGGAPKCKFWKSRDAIIETRKSFERHVQKVAPDFKLGTSENPEPKIGPKLKKASTYEDARRVQRAEDVQVIRVLKEVRAGIDKEIVIERERHAAKSTNGTELPEKLINARPDWSRYKGLLEHNRRSKTESSQPPERRSQEADWSRFRLLVDAEDQRLEDPQVDGSEQRQSTDFDNDIGPDLY